MFESAVDGLGGSVAGAGPVEVDEDVAGSLAEGAAQLAELAQGGGNAFFEGVEDGGHCLLTLGGVGVAVRRDHPLQDAPGGLDLDVVLVGEQYAEAFSSPVGEEVLTGVQGLAGPAQRVVLVAAVAVEP